MDRAVVEQMLGEGLSLAEIGRRLDRHESTVAHWIRRHGLVAVNVERHAARGAIERADLERLVLDGASIAQIATHFDRSKASVRHWLGSYGLKTDGPRGRRSRDGSRRAREAGLTEVELECTRHGRCKHVRESRGYFRCCRCRREAVARRRRRVKEILVAEAGGACRLCGYDRCVAALQFHHVDRATKEFGVAAGGMARSLERMRAEVRKCVLLCANCHVEVEADLVALAPEHAGRLE
jgi:transposase